MTPTHGEQMHAQMHLGRPRHRPLQRGGQQRLSLNRLAAGLVLGLSVSVIACKELTGSQPLPSGTVNPTFYSTPAGAMGLRTQALYTLEGALPSYLTNSGLLADELESTSTGIPPNLASQVSLQTERAVDARVLPEVGFGGIGGTVTDADYTRLQVVRNNISQALAAIAAYDTGAKAIGDPRHLRAELFAWQSYTELLLADLFCSGVPLSTLDFHGDFTYHASATTVQVYHDAIVQADSALALGDTSTQVQYLARVLKGRALLDSGDAAAAAQVVASVPDGFQYQLAVNFRYGASNYMTSAGGGTVADTEGHHGLPYLSSGDPRSAVITLFPAGGVVTLNQGGPSYTRPIPITFPSKYSISGFRPFVVASGVEARLIEAEAALRAGSSSWLTTLNALRTSGSVASTYTRTCQPTVTDANGNITQQGSPCPDSATAAPGATWRDTTWSPGIGIYLIPAAVQADVGPVCPVPSNGQSLACADTVWYKGLHPLTDPETDSARVALLFRERAFWLFLTGERQGDLRRLLRQYAQWFPSQDHVYPSGPYLGGGTQSYGTDVTAPLPSSEYLNPLFHGCLDRNP